MDKNDTLYKPAKQENSEASSQEMLSSYFVNQVPPTVHYIPCFITCMEEEELLNHVYSVPKPKWTCLSNRRLQNWGGYPHPKGMLSEPLPTWLMDYINRITKLGVFEGHVPNHVLINEYLPGQGIMPHEDGPLFFPVITTINLGSHAVLNYYQKLMPTEDWRKNNESQSHTESRHVTSLLLEPRSLLIVRDDMYTKYLHGIEEVENDILTSKIANLNHCNANNGDVLKRSTRISVTIRYVPNAFKTKLWLTKFK